MSPEAAGIDDDDQDHQQVLFNASTCVSLRVHAIPIPREEGWDAPPFYSLT